MKDTYQGPMQGFRGEVTRACMRAIRQNGNVCPECGETVKDVKDHAIYCTELRADIADGL